MSETTTDKRLQELRERLLGARYDVDSRAVATAIVARLSSPESRPA